MFPQSNNCHLACECAKIAKLPFLPVVEEHCFCSVSRVDIDIEGARLTGRSVGSYSSIFSGCFGELEEDAVSEIAEKTAYEIGRLCNNKKIASDAKFLIVGLGNGGVTYDSLGTRVCEQLLPTERMRILPVGVYGKSGIESRAAVKSIVHYTGAEAVIVVDSLAALTDERVGRVIQLSDSGISPGSGGGVKGGDIEEEFIEVPVIAMGVPTVLADTELNKKGYFCVGGNILNLCRQAAEVISKAIKIYFEI